MSVRDDRVKLPPLTAAVLWSTVGIIGIVFVTNKGAALSYPEVFLMISGSLFSGLASYGLVCIIGTIKRQKNIKGVLTEMYNNIKDAL